MTDLIVWGGPVYCSTIEKVQWARPTKVFCNALEGMSNDSFYRQLAATGDPMGALLAKAKMAEKPGSIGLAGFSAFHEFCSPFLNDVADQVDYVHLADSCFMGAGATAAKEGYLKFARRAIAGQARMTVTTNGPWDKDIHYMGPPGSKYDGVSFDLTSGAKCFHNVWKAATGDASQSKADVPPGVPQPDRIFKKGELYWFHYEGVGQKDPHGWHTNVLAAPYIQFYGAPWMAGQRGGLGDPKGLLIGAIFAALGALGAKLFWDWYFEDEAKPNRKSLK